MKFTQIQHALAAGFVRRHSRILIASFLALSTTMGAFGASIGLKLGINSNGGLQNTATGALAPTDVAGAMPYQQANWNVLGRWGNSAGSFDILDSAGNVSGVVVHWDATGIWSQSGGGTPTD